MSEEKSLYEERIRQLEKELKKSAEKLDQYRKEQEEFFLIASHDLQAPLRKISTYTERLITKVKDPPDETKIYTERIHSAVNSMRNLIEGLSHMYAATENVDTVVKCDLNIVLQNVLEDIEPGTGEVIIHSPLPVIEGNRIQLKQLFHNLVENALKFKKIGSSVRIVISARLCGEKETEGYHLQRDKIYYKIEITDNGIGFDNVNAEKIFQPFQRLHGKSEYDGNGLGLAICKKIVEKHRGIIYATGSSDAGARFVLILPEISD